MNYKDCTFACEKEKESTARLVAFKEINIVNSYTLEASFYKSDYISTKKLKLDSSTAANDSNFSNRRGTIVGSSNSNDHFEIFDFVQIGRDFAKAISHASTNTVLK